MSGLWQGRILVVCDTALQNPLQILHMPADFDERNFEVIAAPVFMRLHEYICMDVALSEPVRSSW